MGAQAERPSLEVADIFRAYKKEYCHTHTPSVAQLAVMRHIEQCRTAALGGHKDQCERCGYTRISYNSCRDRHCPKCQSLKKAQWLQDRLERLLPVAYFHVVFTLPNELNPLALRNKKRVFTILFETAAKTLQEIAADKKHLGAQIGFTAILHSWGQNLLFHPHLHCVCTGGGLSPDGMSWVSTRPGFFLPVKVLGKLFRGKFLQSLHNAYLAGTFDLSGSCSGLANPASWQRLLTTLYSKDWVVYAKPPFGGPQEVFRYLGRYTHRVAISNHRLQKLQNGRVTFQVKDYTDGAKKKLLTLEAVEFIRRFLLHVLPKGFVRIRHYGLCASQNVRTKLEQARRLLDPALEEKETPTKTPTPLPWWERVLALTGVDVMACPQCGQGRLVRTPLPEDSLSPILESGSRAAAYWDTS